jgi:hypothetical protein
MFRFLRSLQIFFQSGYASLTAIVLSTEMNVALGRMRETSMENNS